MRVASGARGVEKTVEYYMSLPYEVLVKPSDGGWFAKVPDLPGCMTSADTWEELGPMIEDAKRGYIEVSLEHGDPVPEPQVTVEKLPWADRVRKAGEKRRSGDGAP